MSETNPLVGTWKLKSFETRTSDGSVLYPWGRETVGYIIFSPDGYFFATIMGATHKRFPSQDMKGGSLEERASAADSYISCGPCEIEKDKFRVKVQISLFPNWVGGYQEQNYKIEGKNALCIDHSNACWWKRSSRLFDLRACLKLILELQYLKAHSSRSTI